MMTTLAFNELIRTKLIDKTDKILFLSNIQLTFSCSRSTKETLEKGVKYVQS